MRHVSRMRSKRFSFSLAVWGLGCVRSTLLLCPQPSADAQGEDNMALPLASSVDVVTLGGFKRRVASFRVAGVALRDIPACFIMCPKSFCVTRAMLLRSFQKMASIFRSRHSTLETSIVILRGSVACFLRSALSGLGEVVTTCKFRDRRGTSV